MNKESLIVAATTNSDFMETAIWVKTPNELKTFLWENVESHKEDLSEEDGFSFPTQQEINAFVDACRDVEAYLPLYSNGSQEFGVTIRYLAEAR